MLKEYGSWEACPNTISARIVEMEGVSMSEVGTVSANTFFKQSLKKQRFVEKVSIHHKKLFMLYLLYVNSIQLNISKSNFSRN